MLKRIIDISISIMIIVLFSPLIALILLYVFLITGDNPVFLQERKISLDKKGFKLIKIRTIRNSKQFFELESKSHKIFIKEGYEKFIPPFCRWLRKSGFDEILQIFNVLKGEMSIVGPRPLLITDLLIMQKSENDLYQKRTRINSKPGITGYWQILGERAKGAENMVELDEKYENEKSLLFDLKIIVRTFLIFATASHSDSIICNKKKSSTLNIEQIKYTYYKILSNKILSILPESYRN
jgi:lipopolysaccharide/colanic/teichoic acid biosynthesis glycosyltransferase